MKKWLDKYQSKGEVKSPYKYKSQNLVNPTFNELATTTYNVTPKSLKVIKNNNKKRLPIKLQNQIFANNTRENVLDNRRNYYFPYETEQTKNIRNLADDQVFKSSGDLISAVHPIGAVINALYQDVDQTLPAEGLRFLPNEIPFKQAKTYNNLIPILKPLSRIIDPIQMFDKLHTADSLYNSADSIDLYNQFKNGGLVSKNSLNRTVTCSNCGWSWKLSDGGEDPLTCHKCGGTIKMKHGGELDEYQTKGEVKSTFNPYENVNRIGTSDNTRVYRVNPDQVEKAKQAAAIKNKKIVQEYQQNQRSFIGPDKRTKAEIDKAIALKKEYDRVKAMQNSDLAKTFASFTPGNNIEAGVMGAETFANLNPLISGPILATSRLAPAILHPTNNAYWGSGRSNLENTLGALGAIGDISMVSPFLKIPLSKTGKYLTEKTALKNAYNILPEGIFKRYSKLKNPSKSYRVAGLDAFEDFKNTGILTSNNTQPGQLVEGTNFILPSRPTPFPSFQKGYADMAYANPKGSVVFETELPTFKRGEINPVTGLSIKGRHYAHRVIDPKTGAVMTEIPAENIRVFGDKPHWLQGYPQIKVPNKNFKSEINWANWNKEIPANAPLMKEYSAIEQTTKANGTWMKNPDGSKYKGTPEQFIQQNSENFKKAYKKGFNTGYRGQTLPTEIVGGGNRGYAENIVFLGDKDQAMTYAETWKHPRHSGKIYQPDMDNLDEYAYTKKPALYELIYPNSNNKKIITHPEARSWQKLTDNDIASQMDEYLLELRGKSKKGELFVTTDDVANFVDKNNLDYASIPNIMDYNRKPTRKFFNLLPGKNVGNTTIVNSKPGNYLKSRWYNNGMFDMTNPNIYKAIVPAAIGAGALNQKQEGGAIITDRGQWDYPGQTTIIPSNEITMRGVSYPVLGVDNTGYTQMMQPEMDYTFPGQYVTEYPMAQNGKEVKKDNIRQAYIDAYNNYSKRKFPAETLPIRQKAFRTVNPSSYLDFQNYNRWNRDEQRDVFYDPRSEEAWNFYLGLSKPEDLKYIRKSQYRPTINATDQNYYALDPELEQDIFNTFKDKVILNKTLQTDEGKVNTRLSGKNGAGALGRFGVSRGHDETGDYLSYYDKYDLKDFAQDEAKGMPYSIYNRIYYPKKQYGGQNTDWEIIG